jgi:hypothetical protein
VRRGLLFISLVLGCSGAPLATEFELAHAKEAALDDEGALQLYRLVRTECERPGAKPREHDDCALALVREAQLLERHHRYKEAYATWLEVPKRSKDRRKSARALARAAQLAADELADDAAAERLAWNTVERFPDEVPSDDALALGVRLGKKRDAAALAVRLETLWPNVAQLDIGDNVLYERAELQRTRAENPALAVPMYDQLAQTYPRSGLRDDAIWHAAELLRAAGDPKGALKRLRIILESRRDALITGSYNSLYLDDAQLLFGQILLDDLHEVERAIEAFATLADDYPESVLKDDGLVELARAYLSRHAPPSAADKRAACDALKRLFAKYPDSNRTRQAQKLSTETACPG